MSFQFKATLKSEKLLRIGQSIKVSQLCKVHTFFQLLIDSDGVLVWVFNIYIINTYFLLEMLSIFPNLYIL